MTELKVAKIWFSDWAIIHRLNDLVIEYEQLKAYWDDRRKGRDGMDYKTKCTACGIGHAAVERTILSHEPPEGSCYHCCSNPDCTRRTATYSGSQDYAHEKSWAEWCWMQSMCDEVTADCVAKIAVAVPDGRILEPNLCNIEMYRPVSTESVGSGESSRNIPDDTSHISISFAFRDELLTGQAWATKQVPGTVYCFSGLIWLVQSWTNGIRHTSEDDTYPDQTYDCESNKWLLWADHLSDASDETVTFIHRPEGGK